jgi:hypothetical protein
MMSVFVALSAATAPRATQLVLWFAVGPLSGTDVFWRQSF